MSQKPSTNFQTFSNHPLLLVLFTILITEYAECVKLRGQITYLHKRRLLQDAIHCCAVNL